MNNLNLSTENGNSNRGFDYTATEVSDNLTYLISFFTFLSCEVNVYSYLLTQVAVDYLLVIGCSHTNIYRSNSCV